MEHGNYNINYLLDDENGDNVIDTTLITSRDNIKDFIVVMLYNYPHQDITDLDEYSYFYIT